jgi:hypothetical protein
MNASPESISPSVERREVILNRIEHLTALPLLLLSFAIIPLLVGPRFWELSDAREQLFFFWRYSSGRYLPLTWYSRLSWRRIAFSTFAGTG